MKCIVLGAVLGCATSAIAENTTQIIYSEIPGHPTNAVPAGADVPDGTLFDAFDRPYCSPDGLSWIISASTNLGTAEDEIIIVGAGMTGATVVREGTTHGSPTTGENVGLIDMKLGMLNNGDYVFATNTDGPTTGDEYIVYYNGAAWSAAEQEGNTIPGFKTEVFGSTINSSNISAGPGFSYRATSTVGSLPSDQDDFLILNGAVLAQEGVTIPGGSTDPWDNFDSEDFFVSADGASYMAQGDLAGDTNLDDCAVVNDNVVLREGTAIGGFTNAVDNIVNVYMQADGTWYGRGNNENDGIDWVVRNGDVVAVTNEPIVDGTTETFSDAIFAGTFFFMTGNNNGDYVVGGTTSNADDEADAVLVLNGTTVIARQGDPVDADGNGIYDDNVFIDIFNNDDGFLTDDGKLYFTAELYDGDLVALGQAFMVLDTNKAGACPGDIVGVPADGDVNVDDLLAMLAAWGDCPAGCQGSCPSDINGDCTVNVDDLLMLLANWGPCN